VLHPPQRSARLRPRPLPSASQIVPRPARRGRPLRDAFGRACRPRWPIRTKCKVRTCWRQRRMNSLAGSEAAPMRGPTQSSMGRCLRSLAAFILETFGIAARARKEPTDPRLAEVRPCGCVGAAQSLQGALGEEQEVLWAIHSFRRNRNGAKYAELKAPSPWNRDGVRTRSR